MDSLSLNIVRRVIKARENEPYIKFALFEYYPIDTIYNLLTEKYELKISSIKCDKKNNLNIYECSLKEGKNQTIEIANVQHIFDEYNYLIKNNLLMVNTIWPHKLINITSGDSLIRIVEGNATKYIRSNWNNGDYYIYVSYDGKNTIMELIPY